MYLMDKLKEKFGGEDGKEIDPRELNYKVGNTSGMDVTGNIPSELAERVGQMAQRGGGEMEIQIENPTTFYIDRGELYSAIEGLELDVSFHSDPNVGYTSTYKVGQGRGFEVTHEYFTKYLEGFTSFISELEDRDDVNFRTSRINPHISTDERPPLRERMANDVSLDWFGYPISKYGEPYNSMRNSDQRNIFQNSEFMKLFYKLFLKDEVNEPYQLYGLFAQFSEEFREVWKDARRQACDNLYRRENLSGNSLKALEEEFDEKFGLIRTASQTDVGISSEWREIVTGPAGEFENTVILKSQRRINTGTMEDPQPEIVEEDIEIGKLNGENLAGFSELRQIDRIYFEISKNLKEVLDVQNIVEIKEGEEELKKEVLKTLIKCLDKLWEGNGDPYLISVQGKISALNNRKDIPQNQVQEMGQKEKSGIDGEAAKVVAGEKEYFQGDNDDHESLVQRLVRSFEQQMWMESNIMYKIAPAWMVTCGKEYKDGNGELVHRSFEAPEFLWEINVGRKDYGVSLEDEEEYLRELEENTDFRRDVAAASAGLYIWSHFTQIKSDFGTDEIIEDEISPEKAKDIRENGWTWMEWMNEFGVGINFEAMNGNPQTEFKLWKPSHIVAACRAVNITARNELGELHEDLHGCPLKFTIDMEHTSSFGVDPWKEMEELIEQEEWLADSGWDNLPVDKDKPLSSMVRMYHLTKPGHETSQGMGHIHGPFRWGDEQLYTWLYRMVENGFAQGDERASIMYEVGGEMTGTVQKAKLAMNMIELDIAPEDLDPARVDPGEEYKNEEEALIARFFGMDQPNFHKEWAKIEENAFAPLKELMQLEEFDRTWSGSGAIEQGDMRPGEWKQEEYR